MIKLIYADRKLIWQTGIKSVQLLAHMQFSTKKKAWNVAEYIVIIS
jgi:hypothetical protein